MGDDGSTEPKPTSRAGSRRDVRGDVVVRDDEVGGRSVEGEHDGPVDAVERVSWCSSSVPPSVTSAQASRGLRGERLADVRRVLADMCMDIDDHGDEARRTEMKITEIETLPVSVGPGYEYAVIIVLVRTDEGLTGIGEASLAGRGRGVLGILDHFRDLLVGQDPAKIEHWWSEMTRGTFWSNGQVIMSAVAGIDSRSGISRGSDSACRSTSCSAGRRATGSASTGTSSGDSAEALVEDALRWREQGFTALRYGPLAALRRGGSGALGSAAVDRRDDRRDGGVAERSRRRRRPAPRRPHDVQPGRGGIPRSRARAVSPLLLRGPDPAAQPVLLQLVRDKVNLPLATGEQLSHKWEFQPLIENELVDYLRIDMVHAGGITEAKKILAAGEMHGQRSALHHASSPVNGIACLHVDMAVPNFGIQEWMELEPLYELFPNAPRAKDGYVVPPSGPGLGLEFDEDEARRRPSRDAALPSRSWPDGGVADY